MLNIYLSIRSKASSIFDFESATFISLCLNDFKVEIDLTIVVKFIIDSEMSIQYMEKIEHKRRDAAI